MSRRRPVAERGGHPLELVLLLAHELNIDGAAEEATQVASDVLAVERVERIRSTDPWLTTVPRSRSSASFSRRA